MTYEQARLEALRKTDETNVRHGVELRDGVYRVVSVRELSITKPKGGTR